MTASTCETELQFGAYNNALKALTSFAGTAFRRPLA